MFETKLSRVGLVVSLPFLFCLAAAFCVHGLKGALAILLLTAAGVVAAIVFTLIMEWVDLGK